MLATIIQFLEILLLLLTDEYDQEFGNFIMDENSLGEGEILDRLDLARKRSYKTMPPMTFEVARLSHEGRGVAQAVCISQL